ncbi:hypothetical protein BH10ACT7_BH10ACT7_06080 [soil metagenome]
MRLPTLKNESRPSIGRRILATLATLATAALLAVSVPMTAVAAPGNGISEVTVSVKSLRTGPSTVDGLGGVTMGLFADTANNVPGAAVPGLTCVTLANGTCVISVPQTGNGEANNKRFWVGEVAAPAGYFLNGSFNTGNNTTSGSERFASTPAAFRTPVLNNSAVSMPSTGSMPSSATLPPGFSTDTEDRWVTGNAFSVSKNNFDYQPTCTGLKVGILTDLSLSMEGAGLTGAQNAAKAFVAALADKGVAVTLFTFSTTAPANGSDNSTFGPTVVTSGNLNSFNSKINNYDPDDYTNWDRGLAQMVGLVDVAVVLTDGNPTAYGSANPGLWTNLQKNQEAVYSANALKNGNTQILAFGVGNGISGPADNLIAISGPNAWDGTSGNVAAADYFQTTDWAKVATGLTSLAQSVTCQVPIEVTKTEILANGTSQPGQSWNFTASETGDGTLPNPLQKATDANGKASWALSFSSPGQTGTVSLTEAMKTPSWSFVSVSCTNNGNAFPVTNQLPIVLNNLKIGDNIKCAVTNTLPQDSTIKVIKKWVIDGGAPIDNGQQPAGLSAQLKFGNDNKNWNQTYTGYTSAQTVTLDEEITDTNELCRVTDKKVTAPSTQTLPYVAPLAAGANQFTITNYVVCESAPQLQLTKVVTGGVVPATKWTLSATAAGNPVISGPGGVAYTTAKAGVEYTLAEVPVAGFDGSQFTNSAWVCTITDGPGTGTTLPTTNSKVTLSNGTKVECVITNTAKPAVPGFDKAPGTATYNAGDGTWSVSYTLTATNPSAVLPITYDLTDTPVLPTGVTGVSATVQLQGGPVVNVPWTSGTFTVADDAVIAAGGPAKVYTVVLKVSVAPGVLPAKLECANPNSGMKNNALLIPLGGTPIPDDACVNITPPTVTHTKTLTSVNQNPNGTWTVVYDVTVTATGNGGALYHLSDEPKLGAGITATGTATGPAQAAAWNGVANKVLATNEPITGNTSEKYTITLIATVAAGVAGTPAADCTLGAGESGTGFLNTATITVNGSSTTKEDCGSPVKPTVAKKWVSTSQNPDSSWKVTFEVKVTNPSSTSGIVYSLTDTPQFLSGVTITGQTVALNGGAAGVWDGTSPLATQRALAKSTSDTYVIVFTVDVPAGQDPNRLECSLKGAGYGFFNGATMTSGNDSTTVHDCGPVEEGVLPLVEKIVKPGYPKQVVGGDWVIQYEVKVSTPQGNTLAARYDLSDTLKFGTGITIQSSSIAGPGTINPSWTGRGANTSVATNVLLPAGQTHTYTVSVTARLDAGVVNTSAANCTLVQPETGTGFLNTVVLTSGSLERTAEACKSPAAPTFTKDIVGAPVKGVDGKYTITYTLTATNASAVEVNYDLDDTLGFASGVTVNSAKVAAPGSATWNGAGVTRIITGKAMLPDTVDVYTVTVVATPTVNINDADLVCKPATPGKGYFNGAVLASGADSYKDDACGPITKVVPPALASTGSEVYGGLGVAGFVLLALGAAFVVMRKRRQPRH